MSTADDVEESDVSGADSSCGSTGFDIVATAVGDFEWLTPGPCGSDLYVHWVPILLSVFEEAISSMLRCVFALCVAVVSADCCSCCVVLTLLDLDIVIDVDLDVSWRLAGAHDGLVETVVYTVVWACDSYAA